MQSQNFINPSLLVGTQFQDDSAKVGHKSYGYSINDVAHGAQISMEPAREHGLSDMGSLSSAEAYRRQHEITVTVCISNPSLFISNHCLFRQDHLLCFFIFLVLYLG